jgi:uncharacterized membrane protein
MSLVKSTVSIAAVAAAIALTTAAPSYAAAGDEQVPCYGVNSCKGTSDCKTAKNECKGQNGCKGQGFKDLTKEQCAAAGGSLKAPK